MTLNISIKTDAAFYRSYLLIRYEIASEVLEVKLRSNSSLHRLQPTATRNKPSTSLSQVYWPM
jgi:hypothetical protein